MLDSDPAEASARTSDKPELADEADNMDGAREPCMTHLRNSLALTPIHSSRSLSGRSEWSCEKRLDYAEISTLHRKGLDMLTDSSRGALRRSSERLGDARKKSRWEGGRVKVGGLVSVLTCDPRVYTERMSSP